ncbi:MAG: sodium:solute symporter family protein, partial [Pseudomonadota bacterium]
VESISRPDFILPHLILNVDLPLIVVGLFCAGALSASMSTGDALVHATASVAVEDGAGPFMSLSQSQRRFWIRIFIVVFGAIAYFFAVSEGVSLVVLLLTSYGIIAQLAPPVFAALFWRRATTPGVIAGLLAGGSATLVFFFWPEWRPIDLHEGLFGLLVHVPVLVTVSLLTPPQESAHVDTYVSPPAMDGHDTATL